MHFIIENMARALLSSAVLVAFFCLFFLFGLKDIHAAAISLSAATTTSNNASTTLARVGSIVTFGLQFSGTPWEAPKINIFGMGTTSFTGAGVNWSYSTTSANAWTEGPITFYASYGGTTSADATTTITQANLTAANVVFDKTSPSGYSASISAYNGSASSTAAAFTFASAQVGATYYFQIGTGNASSTGSGTISSGSQYVSGINISSLTEGTLSLATVLTDPAGNRGATTTTTTILDMTAPSTPTADPAAGSYSGNQTITLSSSGSTIVKWTTNGTTPTCSTGSSGTITATDNVTIRAIGCDDAENSSSLGTFSYVVTNGSSAGGGGGGSSSNRSTPAATASPAAPKTVAELQTTLQSLLSQLAVLKGAAPGTASVMGATSTFIRDLTSGSSGEDVRALQIWLNAHGFPVALNGVGSAGNETTLFGNLTRAALAKFQASAGITPAVGYFGPKTRAYIQSH